MKILCRVGYDRNRYVYRSWERVFTHCGHEFVLWDASDKPAFDVFDEVNPDLYISPGQLIERDRATTKCVAFRSKLKVVDVANPQPAADTFLSAGAKYCEHLRSDFAYVGNYRGEKRALLNAYIAPLIHVGNLKVFGEQPWPFTCYLSTVRETTMQDIYVSAKICPNVSFNGVATERVYQILLNGGLCVSNVLTDGIFTSDIVPQANTSGEFHQLIRTLSKQSEKVTRAKLARRGRDIVIDSHTYWHRCRDILDDAGFPRESDTLMETYRAAIAV